MTELIMIVDEAEGRVEDDRGNSIATRNLPLAAVVDKLSAQESLTGDPHSE